jgi:hypothetical protein
MTTKPAAAKKSTPAKWLIRLGILLVLYTVVGFFAVPAVVKSQLLKRLPALTHRSAAIEEVKFNPYAMSLTLRGLSLKETNGDVFASFGEFYANFQPWESMFSRSWVFDDVHLWNPTALAVYQADGTFNFSNLSPTNSPAPAPTPTSSAPKALPSVTIHSLSISNASITFDDLTRSPEFKTVMAPLHFSLTNFTTIRDKNSPYTFKAWTESGETFDWAGHITVDPVRSEGILKITGIKLPKYGIYGKDFAGFEIAGGTLDLSVNYNYDSATNSTDCSVTNTSVKLSGLEIKAPETKETVFSLPLLSIEGIEASLPKHYAKAGLVKSAGGSLLVRQSQDGILNFVPLLQPQNKTAARKAAAPDSSNAPAQLFDALISEIDFSDYSLRFQDQKPPKPAEFKIDQIAFNLKGVSNRTNAPVASKFSLRFQDTGTVQFDGQVTPMPPSADLQLAVSNIDLRAFQPYVEQQIKLAITSGTYDLKGRARYAPPEPGAPKIAFDGDMAVNKFAATDDVLFKDFATFDALDISGIAFQLQPDKCRINEIKFTKLNTSLIIGPDHKSNLQNILRSQMGSQTNAPPQTASVSTNMPFDFSLGTFALENASLHFADQSIEPNCAFDVQEFGGDVKDLSLGGDSPAVIDLKGKVDDRSPFGISGKLSPTPGKLYADIAVNFTNTELTGFSTYTEKFVGRPLQKGKFSFGVHYLVQDKALKAENGFFIDQLTLGPKNDSTNATSLPVKLAIALLKDRHGRIQLDVPVTGRLDDPKFRIGPIIWQVVMNLIEKAATSPFSLLGAAFGGGDELSFVAFDPAQVSIPAAETNKLETLAKALYERPELTVEISGSVDAQKDRAPLTQARLQQQLKTLKAKHLMDAGQPAQAVDQIQIDPAEYTNLLVEAFTAAFGQTNRLATVTNSIVATNSLPPGKSPAKPKKEVKKPLPPVPVQTFAPPPPDEAAIHDMENRLKDKIVISDDDWLEIINKRAAAVQSYLLGTGKVTAERLFITKSKGAASPSKGEDKVSLTLD